MSRVIFRPTVDSDLSAVIGEPLPYRIKALTAVVCDPGSAADDGKILGVGGLAFPPGEPVWAFVQQAPEAKNYPVAFHRAGLMAMKMIRESGIREVVATCDADNPAAVRWLRRLGFVEGPVQKLPGKAVFFWNR
jgi:RimJ/RimL family protein N-acetyltransferase